MKNIDKDIEEYDGKHWNDTDAGIDVPKWDRQDYEYTAEQAGLMVCEVARWQG